MTPRRIEVLTRAGITRPVSVAEIKDRQGIVVATYDAILGALIDQLTSQIETYLGGRPLGRQRYRETLMGDGEQRLLLSRMPVEAASVTVTVGGVAVTDWWTEAGGMLYRASGWDSATEPNIVATYWAGWLLSGQVADWSAGASIAAGAWVRPTVATLSPLRFEAGNAGTAAGTEPVWPTTAGGTVLDGGVTWTAHEVEELPEVVRAVCAIAVRDAYLTRNDRGDLAAVGTGPFSERYHAPGAGAGMVPGLLGVPLQRVLDSLRVAA